MKKAKEDMMKKFLAIASLVLISLQAAQGQSTYLVLVLSSGSPEHLAVAEGFRKGFPGEFREINLEGSDKKLRSFGEELKTSRPSAAVVVGDLAGQMAKWYLEGVPVIYCDVPSATRITLTEGKSIGIYHESDPAEQLKIMDELFPDRRRVGLFYSREYARIDVESIEKEARSLGISLETAPIYSIQDVPNRLRELMPRVDLLWVFTDPVVLSSHSIQYMVIQSLTAGVPIFCGSKILSKSGATAAVVPDPQDVGTKAAMEADKIIKDSSLAFGNMIYPHGKLVLNNKTAGILKITFPPEAAGRAIKVLQ